MIWSYFSNRASDHRAGGREACFATCSLWQPIYHDVGATIPT
jgi:hypothetical protein